MEAIALQSATTQAWPWGVRCGVWGVGLPPRPGSLPPSWSRSRRRFRRLPPPAMHSVPYHHLPCTASRTTTCHAQRPDRMPLKAGYRGRVQGADSRHVPEPFGLRLAVNLLKQNSCMAGQLTLKLHSPSSSQAQDAHRGMRRFRSRGIGLLGAQFFLGAAIGHTYML